MKQPETSLVTRAKKGAADVLEWVLDRLDGPSATFVRSHAALLIPAVLGAIVLGLLISGAGELYESVDEAEGISQLDQPILDAMVDIRSEPLNDVVNVFTHIGGPIISPLLAAAVVIGLAIHWRSWLPVTLMVAATLGSVANTVVGKNYVDRLRPPHEFAIPPYEVSPSFPSGHALNSMVIAGVLAYLLCRRLERPRTRIIVIILALLYTVLMGLSRVYLGHHWLTDVLTGWLLGLAWVGLVITAHRLALELKRRRLDRAPNRKERNEGVTNP